MQLIIVKIVYTLHMYMNANNTLAQSYISL